MHISVSSQHRAHHGFSLVELAVVLVIISLIIGSVISLTSQHMKADKYDSSSKKLMAIDAALRRYVVSAGELPCPAARTLTVNDANFGRESDQDCASATAPLGTVDVGNSTIRIGSVPVRELNLPDGMMFDAWDRQITFMMVKSLAMNDALRTASAVTAPIAHTGSGWGGIRVVNALGHDVFDRRDPAIAPRHFIAYALISHGENRGGARTKQGTPHIGCPTISRDAMNCDDSDHMIRDGDLVNDVSISNSSYFDDLVLWQPVSLINPNIH
ncbi:MAG: type II secretion system protein [Alphaproteobacteria bacterium]|nr:MAG: type II secretion system protein [Alphaproteobacteria bacterium]TAF13844.1 MAG: type II secretion system protein [Alphaproteobacteria bacterium]TAF76272.1 MAG: type II secretion system protein [Alphaproteobacteria bacterium]